MFGKWGSLIMIPVLYWYNFRYRPKVRLKRTDFYPRHLVNDDDE